MGMTNMPVPPVGMRLPITPNDTAPDSVPRKKSQEGKKVTFQHENGSMDLFLDDRQIDILVKRTQNDSKWMIFETSGKRVAINLNNVLFWEVEED